MYANTFTSAVIAGLAFPLLAQGQAISQADQPMLLLSQDESNHFEFTVAMGEAIYQGADVGPLLGIAKDLLPYPGDFEHWSSTWYNLANETKALAQDPSLAYDPINVRDTWFSASTYFRRADFYNHGNWSDPRINEYWAEQTAAFDKGLAALPVPGQRVKIPADGFTVEAIWYTPYHESDNCTKRPTLVAGTGYDAAQEDLYHTLVVPGLARGWNVITYEGPGQPSVRRYQGLGFIPQWEKVITPIVDYLLAHQAKVVDEKRLALFGYSFGGELTARAAAFEHRFAAVVLDPAIYSFYDSIVSDWDPSLLNLFNSGNKARFDATILASVAAPNASTSARWGLTQGLWSFKYTSPYDWIQATKQYSLQNITDNIKGPVLVMDGEYETNFKGEATRVKKALGDRADYHMFNGTAGYHCQTGALQELNRVMWAWLHKKLY